MEAQTTAETPNSDKKPEKLTKHQKLIQLSSEHLNKDEKIIASVLGTYETKILGKESIRSGIFLATNEKVVFYAKKMLGYDLEVFPYSNISSIDISKGFMGHTITLFASGNKVSMKWISEGNVHAFVNYVKENIGKKHSTPIEANSNIDIPEQIKKLAELKEQGILTEQEFQEKKKDLLSKL
ncbi:MAG: hypothetical protein GXP46_01675 [Deferribacteres bacterium]|nr:hypothetical protein [Deferribacteres bacterium]